MSVLSSAIIVLFGISSACFSFTQSLVILAVYMGGIGVLDGMYWVMLSFVALEISDSRRSDILFTLILFAQAFGYLTGPPAIGIYFVYVSIVCEIDNYFHFSPARSSNGCLYLYSISDS